MTEDWNPKIHTPNQVHPEGWVLIGFLFVAVGLIVFAFVSLP